MTDYLDSLGVTLRREQAGTRLLYGRINVLFVEQEPDTLRRIINRGMDAAVTHYSRNVAQSGVSFPAGQIEEASLRVVCATLCTYCKWRADGTVKNQSLTIGADELGHVQSHDQCLFYCRDTFKNQYPAYAAALIGMTDAAFAQYEAGRERFWDR